jgi:hypothetical protein
MKTKPSGTLKSTYNRVFFNVFVLFACIISNGHANTALMAKSDFSFCANASDFRFHHWQKNDLAALTDQKFLPERTALEITYPSEGTVWTIPETVELKWHTKNIPVDRAIRFYLVKDDMVVQELGRFENNNFVDGVSLDKSLPAGDNYRVMGIEMFPADKDHIAKFATGFFTINKSPRKKTAQPETVKEVVMAEIAEKVAVAPVEETPVRNTFEGRKITYIKEMNVKNADISISLWDHGRKDGDVVSIYLNGIAVVSNYALTYQRETFDILLDPSKPNDLFLYAHNLGKYPPNTVSIEIKDNTDSDYIVLNSDLKSCEAVLINVKD